MKRSLFVPGVPVPQPRHKIAARGRFARAYIPAAHPIHAYRQAVQLAARAARWKPVDVPVEVEIECVFERPASHFGRRGGVSPAAPKIPPRADWDNLAKGVCDALSGIAWLDDQQIACGTCRKRYARPQESCGTYVVVRSA